MLKERLKNKNFKKSIYKKPKKKVIKLIKNFFKYNSFLKKPKFHKILKTNIRKPNYSIIVKITPNNIFCTLRNDLKKKTIICLSAGILHLKVSKKKLKFIGKFIITCFINKIQKTVKNKRCFLTVSGPAKPRKFATKQFLLSLKKTKMLINILDKKVFNGCRAKKKRRKKRKGLTVLK